ncbi:MAG: polysaccharide deacetylase, partial [Alteriqipengyuania sp.]
EISSTHDALEQAGSTPVWFRPPFGRRLIGLPQEVERAGYRLAMWDVEDRPEDFDGDPQALADDILERARPGSIILMHPMYRHNQSARDALPIVLRGLEERGLRAVTLSELVASGTSIP